MNSLEIGAFVQRYSLSVAAVLKLLPSSPRSLGEPLFPQCKNVA